MSYNINLLGTTYGSSSYDSTVYNGATSSTSTTTTTPAVGTNSSPLTDTGFDILAAATLACIIIFAALLTRFWKRKPALGSTA